MANTKEYYIKINGLTESVSAVESLNKQLDALEKRIKAIDASSVKVSTGGGGNASAMSQEAAVQKEINKLKAEGERLDAKIAASQDEIYKRVDATKQLYKETIADQKAMAAQERLTADAYSNTMQGMKAQLADLKAVINTTDLGDSDKINKLTQEANELTNKLKQMEEAYGTFGRNVGNYKDSLKGIEVTIAGVTREFNSSREAVKVLGEELKSLTYAEKGQTEYAKELRKEYNKLKSAIEDATKSSKFMDEAMDTMQSFTAMQQISRGFSTFFGIDNSEMERQIAKLVALQNALQGLEKIQKQIDSEEGFGKWLAAGSRQIDAFTAKLFGAQKRMGLFVAETRRASIAANAFAKSMKVVGGIAATGGMMLVSSVIGELIEKFSKWVNGGMKAGDAAKVLSGEFNTMANTLDRLKNENASAWFNNMSSDAAYFKNNVFNINNELQKLLGKFGELEKYSKTETSFGIFGGIKKPVADNLPDAKKQFEEQLKLIDEYEKKAENSVMPLRGLLSNIFGETGKYKRNVKELGDAILNDFLYRVQEASQKANDEILKTGKISTNTARDIKELNQEANEDFAVNSVLNNVEMFSDKGEYYAEQIKSVTTALNSLNQVANSTSLDPDRLKQLSVDAMKDGLAKQKAQAELNRKREIDSVNGNPEASALINQKYNRQILEYEKQHNRDMAAAYADLQSLKIEIMNEGWAKEKARLIQERDEKIREIVESEKLVGARREAVIALYNKKIKEAERQFKAERLKIYEDLANDIQNVNRSTFGTEVDTALQNTENSYKEKMRNIGDMIDQYNYMNLHSMTEYYKKVLDETVKEADKEERINQEKLDKEYDYEVKAEEQRHDRLVRANGEYAEQLRQGKITKEQYDNLIEDETEAHNARMNALEKKYAADTVSNTQEALDKKVKAYNDYYTNVIAQIRKGQDEIGKAMNKAIVTDTDKKGAGYGFGIVDYRTTKENYAKLIQAEESAIEKIKAERQKLYDDREAKRISGEYFKQRQEELDAAEDAAITTLKDLQTRSKEAFPEFLQSLMPYAQAIANTINTVVSSVVDIINNTLDEEQEELEREYEQMQEALDKRRDAIKDYSDEINSIEDELSTARGSRRQHLIDQLNAEMELQREAAKERQRLDKEEQKNKEQMQKKQDALDKKRRKAQWYQDLAQAVVNGALAVTMAAINTWPTPAIPMMALAGATTAAQLAVIAANHPFEKGGQLDGGVAQGPRHRDGGIPVLGGRASIEGGEFITNRKTTAKNVDLLDYINSKHKKLNLDDFIDFYSSGKVKKSISSMSPRLKFADGGVIPSLRTDIDINDRLMTAFEDYSDRPVVVSVQDINSRQAAVRNVQVLAGLNPE